MTEFQDILGAVEDGLHQLADHLVGEGFIDEAMKLEDITSQVTELIIEEEEKG